MQTLADTYSMTRVYRIEPVEGELNRALEAMLAFGAVVNILLAWFILRSADSQSDVLLATIFVLAFIIIWLVSGYTSWKAARKRDCCCGGGFFLLGWMRCYTRRATYPHEMLHEFVMKILLGRNFFLDRSVAVEEMEKPRGPLAEGTSTEHDTSAEPVTS